MKKTLVALLALGSVAMADEYQFTGIGLMPAETSDITLASKGDRTWTNLTWANMGNVNAIATDIANVPEIADTGWVAIMQDGTKVADAKVTVDDSELKIGNVSNICLTYTFDVDSLISTYAPGTTDGKLTSLDIGLTMSANQDTYVGVYAVSGSIVTALSGLRDNKPVVGETKTFSFSDTQLQNLDKVVVLFRDGNSAVDKISAMTASGKINATPAVPEPTTGALSLLALAGLCIRRRK